MATTVGFIGMEFVLLLALGYVLLVAAAIVVAALRRWLIAVVGSARHARLRGAVALERQFPER